MNAEEALAKLRGKTWTLPHIIAIAESLVVMIEQCRGRDNEWGEESCGICRDAERTLITAAEKE